MTYHQTILRSSFGKRSHEKGCQPNEPWKKLSNGAMSLSSVAIIVVTKFCLTSNKGRLLRHTFSQNRWTTSQIHYTTPNRRTTRDLTVQEKHGLRPRETGFEREGQYLALFHSKYTLDQTFFYLSNKSFSLTVFYWLRHRKYSLPCKSLYRRSSCVDFDFARLN